MARSYLRQGNVIRQMASPYSLCQRFPYAHFNAMVTKISKWSRIQDSFQITPKMFSLVVCAMPDTSSKFQKDPSITFWVILYTHRQTNKVRQKHYLLGGGKYVNQYQQKKTWQKCSNSQWLYNTMIGRNIQKMCWPRHIKAESKPNMYENYP